MSSELRIRAARANGALSRGPVTPRGKRRSSQNAIRHGLFAQCVLLSNESQEAFEGLLRDYLNRFLPTDAVEHDLIDEMVSACWRLRRLWAIETATFEQELANQESSAGVRRLASAFAALANNSQHLALMQRYETRLHKIYQRAFHNLFLLRAATVQNEPRKLLKTKETDLP
ncbi:MAG: hypothetical protein IT158_22965 [Bryobacterales bacterium]|nr:hypothetical protein [Bryobacterales bacterium]